MRVRKSVEPFTKTIIKFLQVQVSFFSSHCRQETSLHLPTQMIELFIGIYFDSNW